jgi:hypothetical protein
MYIALEDQSKTERNFVGSLDREEIMHWCKIINYHIQVLV